jgi:hypothetical protein
VRGQADTAFDRWSAPGDVGRGELEQLELVDERVSRRIWTTPAIAVVAGDKRPISSNGVLFGLQLTERTKTDPLGAP